MRRYRIIWKLIYPSGRIAPPSVIEVQKTFFSRSGALSPITSNESPFEGGYLLSPIWVDEKAMFNKYRIWVIKNINSTII